MFDNTLNQPSKFKTKNCVKIIYKSRGTYNEDTQIRFKTLMFGSTLCDYSHEYIVAKGTITVSNTEAEDANNNATYK